jgi:hypothetical protein
MSKLTGNEVKNLMEAYQSIYAPIEEEVLNEAPPSSALPVGRTQQFAASRQAAIEARAKQQSASQSANQEKLALQRGTPINVKGAGFGMDIGKGYGATYQGRQAVRVPGAAQRGYEPEINLAGQKMYAYKQGKDIIYQAGQKPAPSISAAASQGAADIKKNWAWLNAPKPQTGSSTPTPRPSGTSSVPTPTSSPSGTGSASALSRPTSSAASAPASKPLASAPVSTPKTTTTSSGDGLAAWAKANQAMIQKSGTQAQKDILSKVQSGQTPTRMTPLGQGSGESIFSKGTSMTPEQGRAQFTSQTSPSSYTGLSQNVNRASDDTQMTRKLTNPKTSLPSGLNASYDYEDRDVVEERWTAEGPTAGTRTGQFGSPGTVSAAYRAGGGDAAAKQRGLSGPQVVAQGKANLERAYRAGGGDAAARKFDDPRESSKRYVTQVGLKNLSQQRSAQQQASVTPTPVRKTSTAPTTPSTPKAPVVVQKPVASAPKPTPSVEPTAPPVPLPKLGTTSGESIFSKGTSMTPEQGREAFKKQVSPSSSQTVSNSYEYDAYDLVLEYLISSGHADSESEANYIMLEMDMETIKGILDLYEAYEDYEYQNLEYDYNDLIEDTIVTLFDEGFTEEEICSLNEEEFAEVFSIIDEAMVKDLAKSAVRALSRHAKKRARELGHDVPDTLSNKKGKKLTGSALQSTERSVKQTRAAQKPASEWEKFTSQIDKDAERQKEAKRRKESKVGGFTPIEKKDYKGRTITAPERVMRDTDDFQSKAALSRNIGDLRAQYKSEKSEKSEPKSVPAPSFTGRLGSMIRGAQSEKEAQVSNPAEKKAPESRKERLARLSASMGATKQERKETRQRRQAEREKARGSASAAVERLRNIGVGKERRER